MKSCTCFSCNVTTLGETTSCATDGFGSLTLSGFSQLATHSSASPATAAAAEEPLSRASRWDNLCMNVMTRLRRLQSEPGRQRRPVVDRWRPGEHGGDPL